MSKGPFRFKKFECQHQRSAMKIGVDGVLIGCWAGIENVNSILDVGCGCGVISLICAQRAPEASVHAIDIDHDSVEECKINFTNSPFGDRLKVAQGDICNLPLDICGNGCKYDLIISNPPFFDSGIKSPNSSRLKARHTAELSPPRLITIAKSLLTPTGKLAMIFPSCDIDRVSERVNSEKMEIVRALLIKGLPSSPVKRALIEVRHEGQTSESKDYNSKCLPIMTLESQPGIPTDEYRQLCRDFYLKF